VTIDEVGKAWRQHTDFNPAGGEANKNPNMNQNVNRNVNAPGRRQRPEQT
jgi:hypothetical protein